MPLDPNFDGLAFGSNLKEDFDGVISRVEFEKAQNRDNYSAVITVEADDGDQVTINAGLGADWASWDGGRSIQHPSDTEEKPRKLNNQTAWAQFIAAAMSAGAAEVLGKRNREQLGNMGYRKAELVEGLRFHFDVVKVAGRTRKGEEWVDTEFERVVPVKWLGEGQTAVQKIQPQAAPVPPTTAPISPAPPVETASSDGAAGSVPGVSMITGAKIKALATSLDHGSWIDQVLILTDESGTPMMDHQQVVDFIADEANYNSLRA